MSITLADEDAREFRRIQREEMRLAETGPAVSPAAMPERSGVTPGRPPATEEPAFELVGELPETDTTNRRKIPAVRRRLIDFAKANPGQWIKYTSTREDPYGKTPSGFASRVTKGEAGFGPGFEGVVRNKTVFVRYQGEKA